MYLVIFTQVISNKAYILIILRLKKKANIKNLFKNLPEFDALMYAVGADHGLSKDDRRFYFDVLNKELNTYL